MQLFRTPNYDFLRWRWPALAVSLAIVAAGAVDLVRRGGLPLGIDFSGGTVVVVRFHRPTGEEAVRRALGGLPGEKVVQQYGRPGDNEVLIRLPELVEERGASLEVGAQQVLDALRRANLGEFELLSQEIVGPVIGRDLQLKGLYATLLSIAGIATYIAIRFRPSFAIGAIVATLHDILVTVAFLGFFGYELSLNVVAALLTITGYSVNDTIVVFDRVRENLRSMRRDALDRVVNASVNQTLARTVITAGTTFLAVLALYLFGGEVLHGFAFTMLVGIVSGTYSTVFIASAIAIILSERQARAR
ncbi:MAG TPA: protein translocase subunit SecF, partial [Vicinamibacterales bacterium]|nr:protein translocase subunit SecF [Vicinamibacterales bacterium]